MSETRIGRRRRERIAARAGHCCSYCRSSQAITGTAMQVAHIKPESRDGTNNDDNLCWCCGECNSYKGDATTWRDSLTGDVVPLFHPSLQRWSEHFAWSDDGSIIVGRTPSGRVTVEVLRLNRPWLVYARRRWITVGWHPPREG